MSSERRSPNLREQSDAIIQAWLDGLGFRIWPDEHAMILEESPELYAELTLGAGTD